MDKAFLDGCRLLTVADVRALMKCHPMFPIIRPLDSALIAGAPRDKFGYTNYATSDNKTVLFNGLNGALVADNVISDSRYGINFISTFVLPKKFCAKLRKQFGSLKNAFENIADLDEAFKCPTMLDKVYDKNGNFMWQTLQIDGVRVPTVKVDNKKILQSGRAYTGAKYQFAFQSKALREFEFEGKKYVQTAQKQLLEVRPIKFRVVNVNDQRNQLLLTLDEANNGGIPVSYDVYIIDKDCRRHHTVSKPLSKYIKSLPSTIFKDFASAQKTVSTDEQGQEN